MGAFQKAVESGRVAPGSYLLVESLDRLSRDRIIPALNRFVELLGKGVRIVTLSDEQEYDSDSINNLTGLLVPLVTMSRANEESETKSRRLRAAWQNKKARAATGEHILTEMAPAWLRVHNGKFEVIKARAVIVQTIFNLTLKGWGKTAVARHLNVEGVSTFGKSSTWYPSYIQKILRNEAVIGRFQPMRLTYDSGRRQRVPDGDPIEGYFPAIVSAADFYRVKHSKPGPSGTKDVLPRNELTGIAFCGRCGGRMIYVNKGAPPKGGAYLACDTARRTANCDARAVRYEEVMTYVFDNLPKIFFLRAQESARAKTGPDYGSEIAGLDAKVAETEGSIARLLDTLERVSSATAEKRLIEHEAQLDALKAQKAELEERQAIAQDGGDFAALLAGAKWTDGIDEGDARQMEYQSILHRISELRRVIEKVVIEKGKPIQIVAKSKH